MRKLALVLAITAALAACGKANDTGSTASTTSSSTSPSSYRSTTPAPSAAPSTAPSPSTAAAGSTSPAPSTDTTVAAGSTTPSTSGSTSAMGAGPSGETVYNQTCQVCHGAGVAGAPKLGDKADWGPRVAQGKDTLYQHAIAGFTGKKGAMPPKGGNTALPDADVKAAVDFMVSKAN